MIGGKETVEMNGRVCQVKRWFQIRLLLGRTTLVGLTHVNQASKDYNTDYQAPTNLSTPRSCAPDDFVCADGTCIPETHHCDHFYDCRDFTDEQYCFG